MTCSIVRKLTPLLIGQDLPEKLASRVWSHVSHCDLCGAHHKALQKSLNTAKQVASMDVPPPLQEDFSATILKEASESSERRTSSSRYGTVHRRRISVAAWAAAAVVLVTGLVLMRGNLTEEREGHSQDEIASAVSIEESERVEFEQGEEMRHLKLMALKSRLDVNRDLTEEELEAKYPVLKSITYPQGTSFIYRSDDPHVTIVWILTRKGDGYQ